jgi:hypothetical protein
MMGTAIAATWLSTNIADATKERTFFIGIIVLRVKRRFQFQVYPKIFSCKILSQFFCYFHNHFTDFVI